MQVDREQYPRSYKKYDLIEIFVDLEELDNSGDDFWMGIIPTEQGILGKVVDLYFAC